MNPSMNAPVILKLSPPMADMLQINFDSVKALKGRFTGDGSFVRGYSRAG